MVRINLVSPRKLADQHLIAEYAEILILISLIKKYSSCEGIKEEFCLGKGHQKFFRNKVLYLKKRHEIIKKEMINRGFKPVKTINLIGVKKSNLKYRKPKEKDIQVIKRRILERINKKPRWYRYYGKIREKLFFTKLLSS